MTGADAWLQALDEFTIGCEVGGVIAQHRQSLISMIALFFIFCSTGPFFWEVNPCQTGFRVSLKRTFRIIVVCFVQCVYPSFCMQYWRISQHWLQSGKKLTWSTNLFSREGKLLPLCWLCDTSTTAAKFVIIELIVIAAAAAPWHRLQHPSHHLWRRLTISLSLPCCWTSRRNRTQCRWSSEKMRLVIPNAYLHVNFW